MTVPPPAPGPPADRPPGWSPPSPPTPASERHGWTAGRVVVLVVGSVCGLVSLGLIVAGGVAAWATNTQRDAAGYLNTGTRSFATRSYAVTSDAIDLGRPTDWVTPEDVLGTLRIRVTPTDRAKGVFVGVGPRAQVEAYLAGVDHVVVDDWDDGEVRTRSARGAAPSTAPSDADIWTAQESGTGTQTLTWQPTGGRWVVVVMNPDAAAGVSVTADAGATLPALAWLAAGLFVVGGALLLAGVVLVTISVVRASR